MQKKNVFLVRNVGEEKFGGGEIYQIYLAKELIKNGFNPFIITNSKKLLEMARDNKIQTLVPPYSKNQNWSGFKNIFLPFYWIFQNQLKLWYERVIKKYEPTVINIQSRDDMIAGTLAAKKCGIEVLWTDHADFKNWVLWNINCQFKNAIGKKIINLSKDAKKVIFISKKIEKETKELIAPKELCNTTMIYNGVEDKSESYRRIGAKPMSFVFLGRVVEEKGVDELIDAFLKVIQKYPEATLNIYGDGDIDFYKNITLKYNNIIFYGMTSKPLEALAKNEVFVLPSHMEGLSLSLIDAAMMGKKIIASDVGGNSEVVANGRAGLLVPAKNSNKLSEAMIYMLKNKKESEKMAKNAREHYKKNFDFEKIFAEKMMPLYNTRKGDKK